MLRTPLISVCVCSHWELNHQSLAVENRSEKQSAAAFCLPRLLREYRTWCAAHHLYSRSIYGAGRVMKELINRAPACLPARARERFRAAPRKKDATPVHHILSDDAFWWMRCGGAWNEILASTSYAEILSTRLPWRKDHLHNFESRICTNWLWATIIFVICVCWKFIITIFAFLKCVLILDYTEKCAGTKDSNKNVGRGMLTLVRLFHEFKQDKIIAAFLVTALRCKIILNKYAHLVIFRIIVIYFIRRMHDLNCCLLNSNPQLTTYRLLV